MMDLDSHQSICGSGPRMSDYQIADKVTIMSSLYLKHMSELHSSRLYRTMFPSEIANRNENLSRTPLDTANRPAQSVYVHHWTLYDS